MLLKNATFASKENKHIEPRSFYDSLREISTLFLSHDDINLFEMNIDWLRLEGTIRQKNDEGVRRPVVTKIIKTITFPDASNYCAHAVAENNATFDFMLSDECLDILKILAQL